MIKRDLDYIVPGIFLEVKKLKGEGNQHNRFTSFDYAGSQSQVMNDDKIDDGGYFASFKYLQALLMPMVSGLNIEVAKMRDHMKGYGKSILNAHRKLNSQEKKTAYLEDEVKE